MRRLYTSLLALAIAALCGEPAIAQEFNKDSIGKYLRMSTFELDTEASAVVMFEKTTVDITPDAHTYLRTTTVHRVIKILKHDAFSVASVKMYLPTDDFQNFVRNVKGVTYNLEGGDVVKTALKKDETFKKKAGDDYEYSFTLPGVKEGSVIDFSYDIITSRFPRMFTWELQDNYPKLQSEYEIRLPSAFEFTTIATVQEPETPLSDEEEAEATAIPFCSVKRNFVGNGRQTSKLWIRRNLPAFKKEPLVHNPGNHRERIDIQVTGRVSGLNTEHYDNTWEKFNEENWKKGFRKEVSGANHFLDDVVDSLTRGKTTERAKARVIFAYVRNHFALNPDKRFTVRKSLSSVFEEREGNYLEINLLLTTMLVHAGIDAAPLALGTTAVISPTQAFPVANRINYLICTAVVDSFRMFFDATNKHNCFGVIGADCFNGFACILGDTGSGVFLSPDMITTKQAIAVKISAFTDTSAKVTITQKMGLNPSEAARKYYAKPGEFTKKRAEWLTKYLPGASTVDSVVADNFENPDTIIVLHEYCTLNFEKNAPPFINAVMFGFYDENPIKSVNRKMPVEFPGKSETSYNMSIVLPHGLAPDSTSQPVKITYGDNDMVYKKAIAYYSDMGVISVTANMEISRIAYDKEDAATLRDFFQKVIEDNKEIITFKKTGQK